MKQLILGLVLLVFAGVAIGTLSSGRYQITVIESSIAIDPNSITLETNLAKLETYIVEQGFTWQQVNNATHIQWRSHAEDAGFTTAELKKFSSMKITLRKMIIQRKKQAIFVAQVEAFLIHIRKAGTDEQIVPLMQELIQNGGDYGVDPNSYI